MELALCGAGPVAAVHALAVEQIEWLRLGAVTDADPRAAAELAARAGVRAERAEALPGDADIVLVSGAPVAHALDVVRALQGGAGVLVEQPLAATLDDADRIVEAAEATGGRVGYLANLAFAPLVDALRFELPAIGPLQFLELRALQAPPADRGDDAAWGGGALLRTGASVIALALVLAAPNRLTEVHTRVLEGDEPGGVDTYAEVDLRFGPALTARVVASWRESMSTWDVQASSAFGVLRAELLPHHVLERNGEPLPPPEPAPGPVPALIEFGYVAQLASLAGSLRAGNRPVLDAAFGRQVLEVVCAAARSAATGVEESIPFGGNRHRSPTQLWHAG